MSVYLYSFLLVNRPHAHAHINNIKPIRLIGPKILKTVSILYTTRSHNGTFRSAATGTLIVSVLTAALYTVSTRHLTLSLSRHTSLVLYTVSPFDVTLTITESLTRAVSLTVLTAYTVSTL